ncbi:MAG: 8-amino-7-oxononanoate synthase [Hyphomonadaceae bacterium]|nr:8-amino-7-oxononanoate synthase [Hyphomonadaceae bacterium]
MTSSSLDAFAAAKLAQLEAANLRRRLAVSDRLDALWIERGGRKLLSFSCNDYLNLSHDPRVKAAAIAAVERYGAGAGASRLVTGNHPLLDALEAKLAAFKGAEAACLFGSGYLANMGITPALVGAGDIVFIDELAHACLWAGAQLSKAEIAPFPHNDMDALEQLMRTKRGGARHALVLTDGVFSMDGDLAPLPDIARLCADYSCWLLADDAHGLGVVGGGRGSARAFTPAPQVDLQMGTLSKAAGSYGGYVCTTRNVVDLLVNRARTEVYSTGLPPASAAAALAALEIMEAEPDRGARAVANAQRFATAIGAAKTETTIVPVLFGDAARALEAQAVLEREGFLVVAIRPPTVPEGTARLRFAFTSNHPADEIDRAAAIVRRLL